MPKFGEEGIESKGPIINFIQENSMFNKSSILGLICVFSILLASAGCNTLEGAGEDVQKAGEKIEDVAK
ncbi:MAG: entericidin A/B family lipoprotein [Nitrospirales bacterium]|nr:entericidin A/B family lipoprotein [Nitrospirales bacterium]